MPLECVCQPLLRFLFMLETIPKVNSTSNDYIVC